jgi:carbamoyltransferase
LVRRSEIYSLSPDLGEKIGLKGLEYDIAGKLMGLQSYSEDEVTKFGISRFKDLDTKDLQSFKNGAFCQTFHDWHEYWWNCTADIFNRFCSNKNEFIGYAGGCAQNTVFNYRLKKIFPNLTIPPHPYDGGISLGCIEFLRIFFGQREFSTEGFPYWQDDEIKEKPKSETIKKAAKMLSEGKIIGWAQGRGELGPRALGNRSILMSAEKQENKDIINEQVKKREPWRPFAGVVLEEFAKEYVDLDSSKFMLYACMVLSNKIPAITHVDNTCRIQTLSQQDNLFFHDLISEYYKLTGLPVLLNTSLNVMGDPIVSIENQILKLAKRANLDAVFIGNKICKNKFY